MRRFIVLLGLLAIVTSGCKGPAAPVEAKLDLDSDPLALLPGSALVVANLDAHALFASPSVGAQVATLANSLLPVGLVAGFEVRRDVDRIVLGVYTASGADVAAVMSGRFDEDKITATVQAAAGAGLDRGMYAGRVTYTAGQLMVSILSPKTAVAGTGDGIRRLLERIQDKKIERAMPPWVVETLSTPGANVALVADFTSQPVAAAALGAIPVPWLSGMVSARVIGNFAPPGMNVAATVTYGDPLQAQGAAEGVHAAEGWLKVLGPLLGGVAPHDLEVTTDGKDLKCKFSLDDQGLASLLALVPRFLPAPR